MKTVLLVEDNDLNRKLITKFIEINNFKVISAVTAEEALNILKSTYPDLILMDIELPGIDGLSAIKIIREMPNLREIPIIVLSAFGMQEDIQKAMEIGSTDYIVKPIDFKIFSNTIKNYLGDNHK